MPFIPRLVGLCRNWFRRDRVERDLDEELKSYTTLVADEAIRRGLSPAEARRAARLDLGGADQVKERVRDVRAGVFLETLWRDVRFAGRQLGKTPGFTAAALLSLGLGIGANTAIFQLLNHPMLSDRRSTWARSACRSSGSRRRASSASRSAGGSTWRCRSAPRGSTGWTTSGSP